MAASAKGIFYFGFCRQAIMAFFVIESPHASCIGACGLLLCRLGDLLAGGDLRKENLKR